MAQTTNALSFKDCKVEFSADGGTTWTNVSGFTSQVTVSGGDRAIGEEYTFDGEGPIVLPGKRATMDVTVRSVYTEGASDPFEVARAAYENATGLQIRWSPKGGSTGNFQYTTDSGYVTSHVYPQGAANDGKPAAFEVKLKTTKVTKSTAA